MSFLSACRKKPVDQTPVWFMRQAGRYMSAYRDVRAKHSMLEVCSTPELAALVTLQPVHSLDVDAAILFSDLLLSLVPMGFELEYSAGVGPVIHNPITSAADVQGIPDVDVEESLGFVGEAAKLVVNELGGKIPLVGFAGAPFTMASYLIEGGSSRRHEKTKRFMYEQPDAWNTLMDRLAHISADLLALQVRNGAEAVQVFDSWVGQLSAGDYLQYVQPHSRTLMEKLRGLAVPTIHFGVGTSALLEHIKEAGGDVIGLDWRAPIDQEWDRLGDVAVQGNLDPVALFAPRDVLRAHVLDIMERAEGRDGHIFNVGHGILPETPIENVQYVIELVHGFGSGGQ
jgi:uroporphyrinogen decarboxylase